MTVTPTSPLDTDGTGIGFGPGRGTRVVLVSVLQQSISFPEIGQTDTISFDLLDFGLSPSTALDLINTNQSIPWYYQDDVLISFAQLDLTVEVTVEASEPFMLNGFIIALGFGIFLVKRQKAKML